MNNLQLGKMYLVKKSFWLLYPTKEVAWKGSSRMCVSYGGASWAYRDAKWFSEEYNCNIIIIEENTCFVLLEHDEAYFKVLDSNGNIGWIRCYDFSKCFELIKE